MKIAVIGLGYVGLSNAILLAQQNEVIGVDLDVAKINLINQSKSPIEDEYIVNYLTTKSLNLTATTNLKKAIVNADYVIIATPTNYDSIRGEFDTTSVDNVIEKSLEIEPETCIIVKSTVPIGYVDTQNQRHNTKNILFSPEFLREGNALYDNLYPSRIIVGEISRRAEIFAELLANASLKKDAEIRLMPAKEAEAVKLYANTYLAMRVAFFNELDNYALAQGLNSKHIITGVCADPRIGDYYNNPSFGYGGYCLPKDTKQLLHEYKNTPQNLINAIVESNETRSSHIASYILRLRPNVIGIYRLIMKTDSDNYRQSSIQSVIRKLQKNQVQVVLYEPIVSEDNYQNMQNIKNLDQFKDMSDIIITNRSCDLLSDVRHKVFTRDIFNQN